MAKGAQENYLSVGALCICLVPKSIVDLFESNCVLFSLIRCLPHNAVGALAQALLSNVKAINESIDEKNIKNTKKTILTLRTSKYRSTLWSSSCMRRSWAFEWRSAITLSLSLVLLRSFSFSLSLFLSLFKCRGNGTLRCASFTDVTFSFSVNWGCNTSWEGSNWCCCCCVDAGGCCCTFRCLCRRYFRFSTSSSGMPMRLSTNPDTLRTTWRRLTSSWAGASLGRTLWWNMASAVRERHGGGVEGQRGS